MVKQQKTGDEQTAEEKKLFAQGFLTEVFLALEIDDAAVAAFLNRHGLSCFGGAVRSTHRYHPSGLDRGSVILGILERLLRRFERWAEETPDAELLHSSARPVWRAGAAVALAHGCCAYSEVVAPESSLRRSEFTVSAETCLDWVRFSLERGDAATPAELLEAVEKIRADVLAGALKLLVPEPALGRALDAAAGGEEHGPGGAVGGAAAMEEDGGEGGVVPMAD